MYISKKALSRRAVLKGAGAAISLPLLDAMVPAFGGSIESPTRLAFVYFPHGAVQKFWTPEGTSNNFTFSPILKPLEGMRDYITVVSGCRNKPGESSNPHGIIEQTWLSCKNPDDRAGDGTTIDQVAAKQIGQTTPLSSLELCGEPGGSISYRGSSGLPLEGNPRKVFYTMFGAGDSNADRIARLKATGSLLDYVLESSKSLNRQLGASDRAIVDDYLTSVREVEDRIQKLLAKADSLGDLPDAPLGTPDDFTELLDIQYEMMALAFQTNQTRIASLRTIKEASMRTFPTVGVDEAFHPLSHHGEDPDKHEKLVRVQAYNTERFAQFIKRLSEIKEGNGNILDSSIILFGSNMANSDLHNNNPLPQLIAGHGGGIKGNQHIAVAPNTPHANVLLTMAQRAGVELEKFGDSTGVVSI